jgi:hypothetical protein
MYSFGANTTYSVGNIDVTGLSSNKTTLVLTAAAVTGTEAIVFYNGTAGYKVTYTPSGGTATTDAVQSVAVSGHSVTLTLATDLATGDRLDITAVGTNPAYDASTQSDDITVTPGNGADVHTSPITFGNSVTDVTVSPSTSVSGASALYTVNFAATDAVAAGDDIFFSETDGPTDFTSVTGIEVIDVTQSWHFVASSTTLTHGTAKVVLDDAIVAGDRITVVMANVTNPPAGSVTDFAAWTSSDQVVADAGAYTIGANASPGVVVSVSPATTGSLATYTISDLRASAAMTGGTSTIEIQGPSGTVFPNDGGFYSVQDSTTSSGSGSVSTVVSGGGTSDVVIKVPNNISSGDMFALVIEDVINPGSASSSDSITLVGSVTGPKPSAPTTTTTTTTTTVPGKKPKPRPVVTALTAKVTVSKKTVEMRLHCASAACKGRITLDHGRVVLGASNYSLGAGKTASFAVHLSQKAITLLARAKHHMLSATETVTVTGGKTVSKQVIVVR